MSVHVVTDSTSGLSASDAISVVPLHVQFGDQVFEDGVTLTHEEFWKRLPTARDLPTTSQPAAGAFRDVYAAHADAEAIVSLHISGDLSGTLESARQGAALLEGGPPVHVIDSRSTSFGLAWAAEAAALVASAGGDAEAAIEQARRVAERTRIMLFVETLDFLLRGGRIGRARHLAGKMLRVRPLLALTDGVIVDIERPRTRRKALERLFEQIVSEGPPQRVAILHGDAEEDAEDLAARLRIALPHLDIDVALGSPVIGAHVGPGTVGVGVLPADAPPPGLTVSR